MTRAVVFAYHNVGVRCLATLLARGVDVALVVTHRDAPGETIWFDSVAERARADRIALAYAEDTRAPALLERVRALAPDFVFSFYYRNMLEPALLAQAARGALNMHGSLLPRYRGRAPVNWAIVHGEVETGATLHYMAEKPDAGPIVGQQAVPILPDDTALDVFGKVTWAAELVLHRSLPGLIAGTAPARAQDLAAGSYFGGRRPEDGRIDWRAGARRIHDLVRAVAPPYPGAFFELAGRTVRLLRTRFEPGPGAAPIGPALRCEGGFAYAECADGARLRLLAFEIDGKPGGADAIIAAFGATRVPLT
ncbi:MAG TPA: formyltransferase [Burkholderiales bacterium]|nr:formyltransferase [Burkholderiales bacterium]